MLYVSSRAFIVPPVVPVGNDCVSLCRRGATCYLNSLLQAMYMTPELRRGLYAIDPEELGLSAQEALEAAAAANTEEPMPASTVDAVKPKGKKAVRTLPLELQRLFAELQASDRSAVSTERLTTLGFGWSANEERVQHDVSVSVCLLNFEHLLIVSTRAGAESHAVHPRRILFERDFGSKTHPRVSAFAPFHALHLILRLVIACMRAWASPKHVVMCVETHVVAKRHCTLLTWVSKAFPT
jgi:Ubiquitin carboxyl-terminal hydrolase